MKKNNYKKIQTYILATFAAGALSVLSSCSKFTDLQPKDALSTATSFSTAANVELAINGVYNAAAVGTYNGSTGRGYAFGAASIEQGEMRGEDMVNIAAFYQITYQATYDASTANNNNMWINLYALINQCNTFIEGVHTAQASGVVSSTAALAYEGEARFLRALAHHELLIQFCRPYLDGNGSAKGIPYRTIAVNSQSAVSQATALGRGTVAADYTALLADLDYAEANLPATQSGGLSRATKGAAIALKTRIKLHMGDWAGVIAEGAKLGTSASAAPFVSPIGGYKLTASPDGPFYSGVSSVTAPGVQATNSESIFSIANSASANGGVNGALPNMFGPSDKNGRGLVCTSPNLYNASFWVSSDTRRSLLQILQNVSGAKYYFNWKYRDIATQSDYAPIIRYAEVLLNVAEAYSRSSQLTNALALLNAVRNRAVATADQYTSTSFTDSKSLTRAILNERRIEFAGEGRRWADIHRLAMDADFSTGGIPAKILISQIDKTGAAYDIVGRPLITPSFAAIPYSNFKFIWPIPNTEIANNPTLAADQNPFY